MKPCDMSVEDLKKTPWFHTVDPNKLTSFNDFAIWLEAILHNACNVFEDSGELLIIETRQLVTRVNGLKIEIYPNEHPPPHFHVKSPNVDASFDIENCFLLNGSIDIRERKKIEFWHKHAKVALIEAWNSTRPTNCSVGRYKET